MSRICRPTGMESRTAVARAGSWGNGSRGFLAGVVTAFGAGGWWLHSIVRALDAARLCVLSDGSFSVT